MNRAAAFLLLCLIALACSAQPDTSAISFPNSGAAAAQKEFLAGVFQLHNFEYADASRHFGAAIKIDPQFAMAYWGVAMTFNHAVWHDQDQPAAKMILARLGTTPEARLAKAPTPREKMYLRAIEILYGPGTKPQRDLAYSAAMADLHRAYPDDLEATAFYALSILGSVPERDFATYIRAAAMLEEVFPTHPNHPGIAHYLIHSYDDPIHAPLGLRAARVYANIAPEAGHAQHMTSHIFLAMGMWNEVVKANENAMSVIDRARAAQGKPSPGCGHYITWLSYGYEQLGRFEDARRTLDGCRQNALAQIASLHTVISSIDPDDSDVGSYAAMRNAFLIDTQLWTGDVAAWTLPAGNFPLSRFTFDFGTALAALKSNDPRALEKVAAVHADLDACKQVLDADTKTEAAFIAEERQREAILTGQLDALVMLGSGKQEPAIASLKNLAATEHSLPLEFGPPTVDKPTQELLGEVLLQLNRPTEAHEAFEAALTAAPGRRNSIGK